MNTQKIAAELQKLDLTVDDEGAVFLVPVALVAWADGMADMKEIEAIAERHAPDECDKDMVCLSEAGRQFLYYNFIYRRPDAALQSRSLDVLRNILDSMSEEKAQRVRDFITGMCVDVAHTSGSGLLGLMNKMDESERLQIGRLARILDLDQGSDSKELLREIGI